MKNKLLIVIKEFYPSMSASGNLLKKLTDRLDKLASVTVLTRKSDDNLKEHEKISNTDIYRVDIKKSFTEKPYNNKNVLFRIFLLFIRTIIFLYKQTALKNYSEKNIRKLEKNILLLIDKKQIDTIMPVTLEEIIATLRVSKKRKVNIVPYLFEVIPTYKSVKPFMIFQKIRIKKIERIKQELYKESKKIFVLPVLSNYFNDNDKKVIVTEHPMVIDETTNGNKPGENTIVTYAGGLDLQIRNPEKLLDIFEEMFSRGLLNKIKIYFYSYGNCQDSLKKFESKHTDIFFSMGQVTPDVAHNKLKNSNIIITIGNHNSKLVPSKLFDCLSTGKPILHFYYDKNDVYIDYLKKYRLSKCIDLNNNTKQNAKEVCDFINRVKQESIPFEEIRNNYVECTPEFVASKIINILNI